MFRQILSTQLENEVITNTTKSVSASSNHEHEKAAKEATEKTKSEEKVAYRTLRAYSSLATMERPVKSRRGRKRVDNASYVSQSNLKLNEMS